jgi:hypothetical protein
VCVLLSYSILVWDIDAAAVIHRLTGHIGSIKDAVELCPNVNMLPELYRDQDRLLFTYLVSPSSIRYYSILQQLV